MRTLSTGSGGIQRKQIRTAACVTRLSVSWPRRPPLAPKACRGSLGHGPRRGCVCVSLRRGRHVLVVPQRFKFTVTAVTGSRLKQPKSPPSQCRTVVPPHKRAARIGTARVRSRPCFCEKEFFEPSANSERLSSSGLDKHQMAGGRRCQTPSATIFDLRLWHQRNSICTAILRPLNWSNQNRCARLRPMTFLQHIGLQARLAFGATGARFDG